MNPWDLTATELLVWGLVIHVICDWLLQNDWMAVNKTKRRIRKTLTHDRGIRLVSPVVLTNWWDRHPAAYVHAGIHGVGFVLIFGWVAIPLALSHLIIDTRTAVAWMASKIKQTAPKPSDAGIDMGTLVRVMVDQSWHVTCLAVAALVVATLS